MSVTGDPPPSKENKVEYISKPKRKRDNEKESPSENIISPVPAPSLVWGSAGNRDGQFNCPTYIAVSSNGTIYVSDRFNHRIQYFDSCGTFLGKWGREGKADGEFNEPVGLAIGICGISSKYPKVMIPKHTSDPSQDPSRAVISEMHLVPELKLFPPGVLPICVSYLGNECIYVADRLNYRMQVFEIENESNGKFIRAWGNKGTGDGEFDGLWDCAFGYTDTSRGSSVVYVLDSNNGRVQAFNCDGSFICKYGDSSDYLASPSGISISKNGIIYIVHTRGVSCLRMNLGKFKIVDGWEISDDDNSWPWSIFVDSESSRPLLGEKNKKGRKNSLGSGMIYITEIDSHVIMQFTMNGEYVGYFDGHDLNHPYGITKYNGVFYITDYLNNRIVTYSTD